jgi:hypothetical protein
LTAQTTQGLISGRVTDAEDRRGIAAHVRCESSATHAVSEVFTDSRGFFVLPLLPPAVYRLRIEATGYQPAERYELELPVGGFLQQNFALRRPGEVPRDTQYPLLPGKHRVVTSYGPDAAPGQASVQPIFSPEAGVKGELEPSVSFVISSELIDALPLAGRDVYALLAVLPGVSTDTGTSRGLGLTADGQRPSASNFLLDGLENNNLITTGPLVAVAPEAIQEYRISIANFSSEYGRTSGYLANAVTRSGGNRFRGLGYINLRNQHLDANGFQQNANLYSRPSDHEAQPGISVSGPVIGNVLFFSLSAEYDRFRSESDPVPYSLPTSNLLSIATLDPSVRTLLNLFPPPVRAANGELTAVTTLRPPTATDRIEGMPRLDWQAGRRARLMIRALAANQRRPDFDWSPYPGFTTPLQDTTISVGASFTWNASSHTTSETRAGYSLDDVSFNRSNNQVPRLTSPVVTLPGSLLTYSYRDRSRNTELVENWTTYLDLHTLKFGGAFLGRQLYGYLAPLEDGYFAFNSVNSFAAAAAASYSTMENRQNGAGLVPNYARNYDYRQFSLYAQDSFRVAQRWMVEYGVRYENFGAPRNTGSIKDTLLPPGFGLALATNLTFLPVASGSERLYDPDNRDFAARAGMSWALTSDGRTLLHGGYGIFYDKPFDSIWLTMSNNNIVWASASLPGTANLQATPAQLLAKYTFSTSAGFPESTVFQAGLRNGRAQEAFAGLERQFSSRLTGTIGLQASSGARLLTTDQINRQYPELNNPPIVNYRAAQGASMYDAMTATLRHRSSRLLLQASYTWSHSIDNQSEPLLGEFFNLESIGPVNPLAGAEVSSFTAQGQPAADRASSDFDQRQNLVLFGSWNPMMRTGGKLARVLAEGWRLSSLAAFRSGFPYSITVSQVLSPLENNTANLVLPDRIFSPLPAPGAPGGKQLLNPLAFKIPPGVTRGKLGRNALTGPGLYSLDLSLSRSFTLPRLPERWRFTLRADAYNFLNHANLGNPCSFFGSPNFSGCDGTPFGEALYGRRDRNPGYPAVTPFDETPRQIQLLLRVSF